MNPFGTITITNIDSGSNPDDCQQGEESFLVNNSGAVNKIVHFAKDALMDMSEYI